MSINLRRPNGYYILKPHKPHKEKTEEDTDSGFDDSLSLLSLSISRERVLFVYNNEAEIEADRDRIANSECFFLSKLIDGPFREATQSRIHIYLNDHIKFDVFAAIIRFADKRQFDRSVPELDFYLKMIQLANIWLYKELIQIIENHLINFIEIGTVSNLHTLANILKLEKLTKTCIQFEQMLDVKMGTLRRGLARRLHDYGRLVDR